MIRPRSHALQYLRFGRTLLRGLGPLAITLCLSGANQVAAEVPTASPASSLTFLSSQTGLHEVADPRELPSGQGDLLLVQFESPTLLEDAPPLSTPLQPDGAHSWDEGFAPRSTGEYRSQLMPHGLIYRSYLAGAKESRIRGVYTHDDNRGYLWDVTLGGRVGLWRYGTTGDVRPEGFQIDLEGAGLLRLDPEEEMDVDSADFRLGVPVTIGNQWYQMKFAYYHLSSHLQDEFLAKHPNYPRLNYSRDVLVWGHSFYTTPELRFYGEVGYAVYHDVSEPWEFQFGVDYAPAVATGWRGAPFAAVNFALREEVDFGGNFVAQAGWAWRGGPASGLLRVGLDYFNGKSDQFSFYDYDENKLGVGIWYDF